MLKQHLSDEVIIRCDLVIGDATGPLNHLPCSERQNSAWVQEPSPIINVLWILLIVYQIYRVSSSPCQWRTNGENFAMLRK